MKRVVVIGGGIAGLATALRIKDVAAERRLPLQVVVLEAGPRLGGNVATERRGGFLIERGPSGFLDSAPATMRLVERLELGPRLVRVSSEARDRFIVRHGRLHLVPTNPAAFARSRSLTVRGKLRMLCEPWVATGAEEDESVHSFAARRLGNEAAEVLVDALVGGVFAGDPRRLSLRSGFPKLFRLERVHGGLFRGMRAMRRDGSGGEGTPGGPAGTLCSFDDGLSVWFSALARVLGDAVQLNAEVRALERVDGRFRLEVNRQHAVSADAVVLATPARRAKGLVSSLDADLAHELQGLTTYASLAVVALGYPRSGTSHSLRGFGFLAPRSERLRLLGCLWDSSLFPGRAPPGYALLRVMLGGARDAGVLAHSDDELKRIAHAELAPLLDLRAPPRQAEVYRHEAAIAQYELGHHERLERLRQACQSYPGLFLCGSSYHGIGINDCIADAELRAQHVVDWAAS